VLIGLALLMALAISNGWVGEGARTLMAGAAAGVLIVTGVWLHERRGRTDAALAALSSGIAAMFAVAVVASQVYDLIPASAALVIAVATGSLATWLAVRWESRGIAALGILGAMLAPVLAGGDAEGISLLVLFVAGAAAVAVLVHQGWRWLSVGTVCLALPQWALFLVDHHQSTLQVLCVLIGFGALARSPRWATRCASPARGSRPRLRSCSCSTPSPSAAAAGSPSAPPPGTTLRPSLSGALRGRIWWPAWRRAVARPCRAT